MPRMDLQQRLIRAHRSVVALKPVGSFEGLVYQKLPCCLEGNNLWVLLNSSRKSLVSALGNFRYQKLTGMVKKVIQQGHERLSVSRRGQPLFDARNVLSVREHEKIATCLREAASAKAGNVALLIPS